jgi:hypothetical protein
VGDVQAMRLYSILKGDITGLRMLNELIVRETLSSLTIHA